MDIKGGYKIETPNSCGCTDAMLMHFLSVCGIRRAGRLFAAEECSYGSIHIHYARQGGRPYSGESL